VIEHRLLADLLGLAWARSEILEVSKSEIDSFGYDMVLSVGLVTRHVQVKASVLGGRTAKQTINQALEVKQSGCIVWVVCRETPTGLVADHYLYFGGEPTQPLPSLGNKVGMNPRGKTPRPGTREVAKGRFEQIPNAEALFDRLFVPNI
jgi:hypothetical protein